VWGENLPLLLKGFRLLLRELPEARLTLVGKGPRAEMLKLPATRLGIAGRISHIERWLSQGELAELYNEAAVFALMSIYEGKLRAVMDAVGECSDLL